MFEAADYAVRGYNFLHNHLFPERKRLSSLMIYATDLCDSGCKHCLIWAKRPTVHLSFEKIVEIMQSKCINSSTTVGLEGGEFLLHPDSEKILNWFSRNHKNFDLFSNCLNPQKLIDAVETYTPKRVYISLDGTRDTYLHMRGKDGYDRVLQVIERLKDKASLFVMFTLSPYNDFTDLDHVADVCKRNGVFLRVGIYNNIPFFDTIDDSVKSHFGQLKNDEILSFRKAELLKKEKSEIHEPGSAIKEKTTGAQDFSAQIPESIKEFKENYGYVRLYQNWASGKLRLSCNSILDSAIILPNGDVPICQNLSIKLGNIFEMSLDEVFNSRKSMQTQKHYSANCNQCWVSYHRKYDIILYRTFEKFFGRSATSKMLGYYKWDEDEKLTYREATGF